MESFAEVWEQVLEYCKNIMSETTYKMWIETIDKAEFIDGKVVISSATEFRNTILKDKFYGTFKEAFENVIGIFSSFFGLIRYDEFIAPFSKL